MRWLMPEFVGNVLVGHAEDEVIENFLLAAGQPRAARSDTTLEGTLGWTRFASLCPAASIAPSSWASEAGFSMKSSAPAFIACDGQRHVAMGGEDDDRNGQALGCQPRSALDAAKAGHAQVDEGAERIGGVEVRHELLAAGAADRVR